VLRASSHIKQFSNLSLYSGAALETIPPHIVVVERVYTIMWAYTISFLISSVSPNQHVSASSQDHHPDTTILIMCRRVLRTTIRTPPSLSCVGESSGLLSGHHHTSPYHKHYSPTVSASPQDYYPDISIIILCRRVLRTTIRTFPSSSCVGESSGLLSGHLHHHLVSASPQDYYPDISIIILCRRVLRTTIRTPPYSSLPRTL
jgi:hypothetical protein